MEAEREERWKWSPEEEEEEKKKKRSEKGEERNLSRLPLLLPYSGRQADPSLLFLFPPSVSSVLFSLSPVCRPTRPPPAAAAAAAADVRPFFHLFHFFMYCTPPRISFLSSLPHFGGPGF